jgi:4-hydroxyphenylacetate 3-monooxygenase
MTARTGAEFLDRLSRTRTHVEIQGETLTGGIPDHPAFKNVVRSYAAPGDYLNSALMALASASTWFAQTDENFAGNITRYYEQVREQDLLCTHTLIPPQANRAQPGSQQQGGTLMAHITREDDNGIVVRGARMATAYQASYDKTPYADRVRAFLAQAD